MFLNKIFYLSDSFRTTFIKPISISDKNLIFIENENILNIIQNNNEDETIAYSLKYINKLFTSCKIVNNKFIGLIYVDDRIIKDIQEKGIYLGYFPFISHDLKINIPTCEQIRNWKIKKILSNG